MAAIPVGALPLPVPVSPPALLSALFVDASKDPINGNWDAPMENFLHDLHNNATNTSTENTRNMVIVSGTGNKLFSITIVSDNRARLYTLFIKWQDGLTGNNPALQNKFFAVEGKLI